MGFLNDQQYQLITNAKLVVWVGGLGFYLVSLSNNPVGMISHHVTTIHPYVWMYCRGVPFHIASAGELGSCSFDWIGWLGDRGYTGLDKWNKHTYQTPLDPKCQKEK